MANDIAAVFDGLDTIANMRLRKAALAEQLRRNAEAEDLNRRRLKLQAEQASERRWERLGREAQAFGARADRLAQQQEATRLKQQMEERAAKESQARIALLEAQKQATAEKPRTPIDGTIQGAGAFADEMAAALEENQAALAAAQAGDPTAQRRVLRSQLKLSALQQVGNQLVRTAKPEAEPTVTVEIDGPMDEATGKTKGRVTMKVPQSKWNEQHPLWAQFHGNQAQPAAGPTLSPTDQQALQWARANPTDPRAKLILQRLTRSP